MSLAHKPYNQKKPLKATLVLEGRHQQKRPLLIQPGGSAQILGEKTHGQCRTTVRWQEGQQDKPWRCLPCPPSLLQHDFPPFCGLGRTDTHPKQSTKVSSPRDMNRSRHSTQRVHPGAWRDMSSPVPPQCRGGSTGWA